MTLRKTIKHRPGMIKNYGLLWQRKFLHFGAGSNKGTLLGIRPRSGQVDFREQIGVYVLYDGNMVPVYVGQAGNGNATLFARLKQHTNDHLWNRWTFFSWFGLKQVNASGALSAHDTAIKTFKPKGGGCSKRARGRLDRSDGAETKQARRQLQIGQTV